MYLSMFVWAGLVGCESRDPVSTTSVSAATLSELPEATLHRNGDAPEVPQATPERADGSCGWMVDISESFALSTRHLRDIGLGDVTPLTLLEDGRPLAAFSSKEQYEQQCAGAFNVGRNVIRFSPSGTGPEAVDTHTYTIALSDALPMSSPAGAVWWVYTNNQLAAHFAGDGGQAGRQVTVNAALRSPQNNPKAAPMLQVGGQQATFTEATPHHWQATLTFTVPEGEWQAEIISPFNGPYLLVDSFTLTADGKERSLLTHTAPPVADGPPVTSGSLLDPNRVRFAGPPPSIPAGQLVAVGDRAAKITSSTFQAISPQNVNTILGIKYSPIRILENGKPLPSPMSPCPRVKSQGEGQYCHSHDVLLFSASDGSHPAENGLQYQPIFAEDRQFTAGWWLYPEDVMTTGAFVGGAITLTATPITEGAQLTARLRNGSGETVVESTFDTATLSAGPVNLSAPSEDTYTVEIHASGHVVTQEITPG